MAANRLTGQRTLSIGKCCKVRGTETVDLNQRQSMPRQSRNSDKVANLCRRGVEVGSVVVFSSDVNGKERVCDGEKRGDCMQMVDSRGEGELAETKYYGVHLGYALRRLPP